MVVPFDWLGLPGGSESRPPPWSMGNCKSSQTYSPHFPALGSGCKWAENPLKGPICRSPRGSNGRKQLPLDLLDVETQLAGGGRVERGSVLLPSWRRQNRSAAVVLLFPRILQNSVDVEVHRSRKSFLDSSRLLNDLVRRFFFVDLSHFVNLRAILPACKGSAIHNHKRPRLR